MGILIRGGRVVDAAAQIDKIADVYLDDGVIQKGRSKPYPSRPSVNP